MHDAWCMMHDAWCMMHESGEVYVYMMRYFLGTNGPTNEQGDSRSRMHTSVILDTWLCCMYLWCGWNFVTNGRTNKAILGVGYQDFIATISILKSYQYFIAIISIFYHPTIFLPHLWYPTDLNWQQCTYSSNSLHTLPPPVSPPAPETFEVIVVLNFVHEYDYNLGCNVLKIHDDDNGFWKWSMHSETSVTLVVLIVAITIGKGRLGGTAEENDEFKDQEHCFHCPVSSDNWAKPLFMLVKVYW